MITTFASQIVPTVVELLAIIVPVGLSCWAIGFGLKKGIAYIQRNAKKSV